MTHISLILKKEILGQNFHFLAIVDQLYPKCFGNLLTPKHIVTVASCFIHRRNLPEKLMEKFMKKIRECASKYEKLSLLLNTGRDPCFKLFKSKIDKFIVAKVVHNKLKSYLF